ncbi:helix-turn-helix domain-containing protein [Nocardioides sp. NPDC057772]|uniref:helix-turn-helix domain-containing protein n=1 Tax=Nocardioides sp. NPDC057772 TaxID=3346245 RepID=UPI00366FCB11
MTGRHPIAQRAAVVDRSTLAPRVRASWQRSQEYGVSVEEVDPVFSGAYDQESLFFQCGREVLDDLHRTLVDEPVSLMLTDPGGLVLNRLSGDQQLLRDLDAVHLAPGFSYAERAAGTNGLGLALADRTPTVVRAEEHYSLSLCSYTCAAAPVIDPISGRLEGSVNLTTWSESSHDLLLALAQSAASNTASLMLARAHGRFPRPAPRGEVFRVEAPRLEPGAGSLRDLSSAWREALGNVREALTVGRRVAVVGEPGAGRTTLVAQVFRDLRPRDRILAASAPDPADAEAWLSLWTPELAKQDTAVVVRDVNMLPAWVAERLHALLVEAVPGTVASVPFAMTADTFDAIPAALADLVDTVVEVPPLRERPEDVLPLAHHVGLRVRGREVALTPAAERALHDHGWPGNVTELVHVVQRAVSAGDQIDLRHLPAEVLSDTRRPLSRIDAFERGEIVRVLTRPGITMQEAAAELGMSRATVYRKVQQYGIRLRPG